MNKIIPEKINTISMSYSLYDLDTRGPLTDLTRLTPKPNLSSYENKTVGLSLLLEINGSPVSGYIDPFILIDNLSDSTDEMNKYSFFYVVSCSCGAAGCNGIHDGIYIKDSGEEISWRIPKEMGYKETEFVEGGVYAFNKKEYIACFSSTIKAIKKALKEYKISVDTVEVSSSMSWRDLMDCKKKFEKEK